MEQTVNFFNETGYIIYEIGGFCDSEGSYCEIPPTQVTDVEEEPTTFILMTKHRVPSVFPVCVLLVTFFHLSSLILIPTLLRASIFCCPAHSPIS
jgi:hypothetical protein